MPLLALAEASEQLSAIRLVATDMDGTLTQQGKFTSALLSALEQLAQAQIPVLVVTGRSAGWVSGLATYLPIAGAIAENGGLFYTTKTESPQFLTAIGELSQHRQQLAQTFAFLKAQFPQLQESADNCFRLTDWTFDVQGLTSEQLQTLADLCQQQGWGFTYSTVQCHIKPQLQVKANALQQVLQRDFPHLTPKQVLTVGDSPNDESLFNPCDFPLSVGVANICHYRDRLIHQPTFVTTAAEGEGFCELAQALIQKQKS